MAVSAGRLSENQKTMLLLTGLMMITISTYLLVLLPQHVQIEEMNMQLKEEQQRIGVIENFILAHPNVDAHLADLEQQRMQVDYMLPPQPNISEYLIQVEREAKTCGVQLVQLKPLPLVKKNGYGEITIEIITQGSFFQFVDFLTKLETGLRFTMVKNVVIHVQQKVLENKLSLVIYQYDVFSNMNGVALKKLKVGALMFRFLTAGESHGPCLTAIIEGLPAGLCIDIDQINHDLARRQQGFGRGGRMKIERDQVEILSGVRFGQTLGSPVTLVVRNRDWTNWEERMSATGEPQGEVVTAARPGHADLTGVLKYQRHDIRDILERASARETAARVAVGAVAKQLLAVCGIKIASHVKNIGGVAIKTTNSKYDELVSKQEISELSCIEPEAEALMKNAIQEAKQQGDTLGGIFEVVAVNVMPGLGSHVQWDRRLDTILAGLVMSIPAIKGVEFGAGFDYADLPGSQAHDEIFYDATRGYYRDSNHAGGIEGGMSNGEEIVVRAVMKPIPTLMKPLASVDVLTQKVVSASTERSDVCAVTAAAVVGEAMMAIGLVQVLFEKFGGDCIEDIRASVTHYRQRIIV